MSILVSNSLARGLRRERAVDTRTADRQWFIGRGYPCWLDWV